MMKRGVLFILVGGFFYICLVLLWCRQYNILTVRAQELTEEITEDYGYLSSFEEDSESDYSVLQDIITPIKDLNNEYEDSEVYSEDDKDTKNGDSFLSDSFKDEDEPKKSLSGLRSVIVNTYDPTNDWLFDERFFYFDYFYSGGHYTGYIFPYNYFGERTSELISIFAESINFTRPIQELNNSDWHCYIITTASTSLVNIYLNANGYPSKNTFWEIPETTPDPTPTPTPEITPTPTPGGEVVLDEKFKIMIIFCFGLSAGVIVGHFLTGFIK